MSENREGILSTPDIDETVEVRLSEAFKLDMFPIFSLRYWEPILIAP